ncbi:MAG TPA: sigma-70 family RNA polymerase sigma factor [Candidatus Eremiobacteraceae bacterium]|nr:sigma-70 family RNA polymerase sigma factor [Candidatus Eremiobacteraceae bacterium]
MPQGLLEELPAEKPVMREIASVNSTSSSFDELFLAHYPRLVAILRRMLGNSGRAEELATDVFLKLHRQPLPAIANGNIPGWMYRTAIHLGIDELRSRSRRARMDQEAARLSAGTSRQQDSLEQLLRAEKQQHVRAVLAELKPNWAELLLLRASGHSYRELAEHLDLTPSSVGTMLVRAEAAFLQRYRELFSEEEL